MDELRKPFFIVAAIAIGLAFFLEVGSTFASNALAELFAGVRLL